MYVKANKTFNYGGIVEMTIGDHEEVKDDLAKKLIDLGLVTENKISHKKIKIKEDEPIDKADNTDSE